MYNTNGYGFNPYQNYGQVPNQVQPVAKVTPWLSQEEQNEIKTAGEQFTLQVSREELLRGNCNHRHNDGTPSLVECGNGNYRCTVCNHEITVNKGASDQDVEAATKLIIDLLQTIKLMYISLPANVGRDYFQIIPLLEKLPKLYRMAANDFKKFDTAGGYIDGAPVNAFTLFSALTTPMVGNPYTQPVYGQPYGAPMPTPDQTGYQQAPYQAGPNPFYAQPGYPQAPVGYQPQPQNFSVNAQGAAAPQQPTQPANNSVANPPAVPQGGNGAVDIKLKG